ncbi:MAG: helix-turn-helix domain-containing protein [Deltaproteobacteria bacterium]|nr:helix-turn-helix domain-containing protein [Deltaproteobacteria bacterium]
MLGQARPVRGQDYLTVADVAAALSVSAATVYRLCERGELEHFRVLNAIRVTRSALDRFASQAAG